MNNQYKQFKDDGVQVLAVNVGETDLAVNKFSERYDLSFPIVIDKNTQVNQLTGLILFLQLSLSIKTVR